MYLKHQLKTLLYVRDLAKVLNKGLHFLMGTIIINLFHIARFDRGS